MTFVRMIRSAAFLSAVCFFAANAPMTLAQDSAADGPPKILVIQREITKPGKGGALHLKSEQAFIRAMAAAKAAPRYIAMSALSGTPRVLFFSGYPSLAAWEAEDKSVDKDTALSATLDRLNVADGDLLTETAQSVWQRRDDLSMNPGNLQGDRYMEITQFKVRPGHVHEWEELVKMVQEGYKKGSPDANWVMFEQLYGTGGNAYIVISKLKSMTEADQHLASGKQFADAMGEDGMKKMSELEAACVESEQTNLFALDPKMSYPPEVLTKAEPEFWKQPTAAPAAKKAAQ